MAPFRFEHTYYLSEREYVELTGLILGPVSAPRLLRRAIIVSAAVAALFWSYTLSLGVAILVLAAFNTFMPRALPATAARNYATYKHLHEPVTYGADDSRVWFRASDFVSEVAWRHVRVWRFSGRWLVLGVNQTPQILLPIADMQAQGVFDDVMRLARQHAVEYNSAAANAKFAAEQQRPTGV